MKILCEAGSSWFKVEIYLLDWEVQLICTTSGLGRDSVFIFGLESQNNFKFLKHQGFCSFSLSDRTLNTIHVMNR